MIRLKFLPGLLCTWAVCYGAKILHQHRQPLTKTAEDKLKGPVSQAEKPEPSEKKTATVLVHDTVARSIYAYDNSNHNSLVHVRFDRQTADLLNKFKMATGTDITKFVAFSVKYLFESSPELKTIIKQFIQNTEL